MLVSDGLVQAEKIGTSNYYYSYPNDNYLKVFQFELLVAAQKTSIDPRNSKCQREE